MNGYKVVMWQPIYHNSKFSHNTERFLIVHCVDEDSARKRIEEVLKPEGKNIISEDLTIFAQPEYIKSVEYLGRVHWKQVAEYIK